MAFITNRILVNGIEPAPVHTQEHLAAIAAARPIAGQELPPAPYVAKPTPIANTADVSHTIKNARIKDSQYMSDIFNN